MVSQSLNFGKKKKTIKFNQSPPTLQSFFKQILSLAAEIH